MNPYPRLQTLENKQQYQEQTVETKEFLQGIFKVNYINNSKIVYRADSHSAEVKINNYLCYQEDQNFYKITEIVYEDRLIRIEDKFQVSLDGDQVNQSVEKLELKQDKEQKKPLKSVEKVRMFNKNLNKQGKCAKKDKKNIVKNVVKIFHAWLDKKSQNYSSASIYAFEILQKLLQEQNFNNRLIKKMAENKQLSKQFLKFLEDDAENEIKYSKIQDKQSHYEALQIYKDLLITDSQDKEDEAIVHSQPRLISHGNFYTVSPSKQQKIGEQNDRQYQNNEEFDLRPKDRKKQKNRKPGLPVSKSQKIVKIRQTLD